MAFKEGRVGNKRETAHLDDHLPKKAIGSRRGIWSLSIVMSKTSLESHGQIAYLLQSVWSVGPADRQFDSLALYNAVRLTQFEWEWHDNDDQYRNILKAVAQKRGQSLSTNLFNTT